MLRQETFNFKQDTIELLQGVGFNLDRQYGTKTEFIFPYLKLEKRSVSNLKTYELNFNGDIRKLNG